MARWTNVAAWRGPAANNFGDGDYVEREPADALTEVRGLVVHIADGTFAGTISWERNPASNVSSHFVAAKDGRLAQMVDTHDRAAGRPRQRLEVDVDATSVGDVEHRDGDENERDLQPIGDLRGNLGLADVALAQVEAQQPTHPVEELRGQRPVQAVFLDQRRMARRVDAALARQRLDRVARDHADQEKHQQRHAQKGGNDQTQAGKDETYQGRRLSEVGGRRCDCHWYFPAKAPRGCTGDSSDHHSGFAGWCVSTESGQTLGRTLQLVAAR